MNRLMRRLSAFFSGELKAFEGRENLDPDAFYGRFYADSGLDRQSILEFLDHLAFEMDLPADKLRPSDRFTVELSERTTEWDSGFGVLMGEAKRLAKRNGIEIQGKIESVDDYIRWMCAIRKVDPHSF